MLIICQDGVCDRQTVPSVSSISRLLRSKGHDDNDEDDHVIEVDDVTKNTMTSSTKQPVDKHSIEGILGHHSDREAEEDADDDLLDDDEAGRWRC